MKATFIFSKQTILALFVSIIYSCNAQKPIAFIQNDTYIINDSIKLKEAIKYDLSKNAKDLTINKIEIKAIETIGEKSEKVYFIQFSDTYKKRRIAKYLFLKGNEFYYYEDVGENLKKNEQEGFAASYFACYGSLDKECSPNIAIVDGHKQWIAGNVLICDTNSTCKTAQIYVIKE